MNQGGERDSGPKSQRGKGRDTAAEFRYAERECGRQHHSRPFQTLPRPGCIPDLDPLPPHPALRYISPLCFRYLPVASMEFRHGRSQEHSGHSFPPPVISVPLNLSPWGSPGLSISDFWGFTEKMTITVFVKFVHHFFLVLSLTRVKDFP